MHNHTTGNLVCVRLFSISLIEYPMIPFRMLISYPLCYAFERTVIRSQTFEKTWSNIRPHLEKGIELIAQEAHPEGRSLLRKYVYQEPAVRRVVNDCLREILSTDIMCMVSEVQSNRKKISARKEEIIEWEKDLIGSPKKSWNPLNTSVSQLKEKIERNKAKNAADEKHNQALIDSSLEKLKARGVKLSRAQLEGLVNTADGEDVAAIMATADSIRLIFQKMEAQVRSEGATPELSKSYAGFYMMCCRLYIEAIDRALLKIEKFYLPRVSGIEKNALKQIRSAESKLSHSQITKVQTDILKKNCLINEQIIDVAKFYTKHLNSRAKDLLELKDKAELNYDISVNTFFTMKAGADLSLLMKNSEQDLRRIFEFEMPSPAVLYDVGFGEQFTAVTRQLQQK